MVAIGGHARAPKFGTRYAGLIFICLLFFFCPLGLLWYLTSLRDIAV